MSSPVSKAAGALAELFESLPADISRLRMENEIERVLIENGIKQKPPEQWFNK